MTSNETTTYAWLCHDCFERGEVELDDYGQDNPKEGVAKDHRRTSPGCEGNLDWWVDDPPLTEEPAAPEKPVAMDQAEELAAVATDEPAAAITDEGCAHTPKDQWTLAKTARPGSEYALCQHRVRVLEVVRETAMYNVCRVEVLGPIGDVPPLLWGGELYDIECRFTAQQPIEARDGAPELAA